MMNPWSLLKGSYPQTLNFELLSTREKFAEPGCLNGWVATRVEDLTGVHLLDRHLVT